MTNNQINHNSIWRAVTSVILGIIAGIFIILAYVFPSYYSWIIIKGMFFVALLGVILGILGLKSKKRSLATVGIILCTSELIVVLKAYI